MKILEVHEISQPRAPHPIEHGADETNWVLGATSTRPNLIVNTSMDYTTAIVEFELQRNGIFDPYDCVTQSLINMVQTLANFQYGVKLDLSKRYTAVESGTVPHQGNSVLAPCESLRKQGCVAEAVYPTMTPTMTEVEFFQKISAAIEAQESFSKDWLFTHEWVQTTPSFNPFAKVFSTPEQIMAGMTISPVMVAVNGYYQFDSNGYLSNDDGNYSHEILLVKPVPGQYWLALDSENPNGLIKVKWDYKFYAPKIGHLKKKTMTFYKETDKTALYQLGVDGTYYPVLSGEYFKKLFGEYSANTIVEVPSLAPEKISNLGVELKQY